MDRCPPSELPFYSNGIVPKLPRPSTKSYVNNISLCQETTLTACVCTYPIVKTVLGSYFLLTLISPGVVLFTLWHIMDRVFPG